MDANVLEESCFSDRDINLFVAYFAFDEYPLNTKKQVFLAELIIHFFFPKGLDLMKETDVISVSDFGHCWILEMKKSRDFSISLYIDFVYCFDKEIYCIYQKRFVYRFICIKWDLY